MAGFSPENKYIVPSQYTEDVEHAIAEFERNVDAPWSPPGFKRGPFELPRVQTPAKKIESILKTKDHGDKGRQGHAERIDVVKGNVVTNPTNNLRGAIRSMGITYSSVNSPANEPSDD